MINKLLYQTIFALALSLITYKAIAQDTQFSTEYNMPNYLNPALAGIGAPHARGTYAFRLQWPSLNAYSFSTYIGLEEYFPKYNSGIGFYTVQDNFAHGTLKRRSYNMQYAYSIELNDKTSMNLGGGIGILQYLVDENALTFPNQYDNSGLNGLSSGENGLQRSKIAPDFSAGAIIYGDHFWISASALHINNPNVSLSNLDDPYPMRFTLNLGYSIDISETKYNRYDYNKTRRSIIPILHYKHQGNSDQLDLGAYAMYDVFLAGLYYRGIPTKKYSPEFHNNEAIVIMIGYNYNHHVHISYSYDIVTSQLAGYSGGSHEINIQLVPLIPVKVWKNKPKPQKSLPCPTFMERE